MGNHPVLEGAIVKYKFCGNDDCTALIVWKTTNCRLPGTSPAVTWYLVRHQPRFTLHLRCTSFFHKSFPFLFPFPFLPARSAKTWNPTSREFILHPQIQIVQVRLLQDSAVGWPFSRKNLCPKLEHFDIFERFLTTFQSHQGVVDLSYSPRSFNVFFPPVVVFRWRFCSGNNNQWAQGRSNSIQEKLKSRKRRHKKRRNKKTKHFDWSTMMPLATWKIIYDQPSSEKWEFEDDLRHQVPKLWKRWRDVKKQFFKWKANHWRARSQS